MINNRAIEGNEQYLPTWKIDQKNILRNVYICGVERYLLTLPIKSYFTPESPHHQPSK